MTLDERVGHATTSALRELLLEDIRYRVENGLPYVCELVRYDGLCWYDKGYEVDDS